MTRYVFDGGRFVDRATGSPMLSEAERSGPICAPMVVSDIPEYRSPVDGRLISSRSARRDDLKKHGCVPYEPSLSPVNKERFEESRAKRKAKLK